MAKPFAAGAGVELFPFNGNGLIGEASHVQKPWNGDRALPRLERVKVRRFSESRRKYRDLHIPRLNWSGERTLPACSVWRPAKHTSGETPEATGGTPVLPGS